MTANMSTEGASDLYCPSRSCHGLTMASMPFPFRFCRCFSLARVRAWIARSSLAMTPSGFVANSPVSCRLAAMSVAHTVAQDNVIPQTQFAAFRPPAAYSGTLAPSRKPSSGLDALPSRARFLTPCRIAPMRKKAKAR